MESKKLLNNPIVPKKIRVKKRGGDPMLSMFWTLMFLFGRGSDVLSMLWTSVVQVDDDEQMNKKVDRSR